MTETLDKKQFRVTIFGSARAKENMLKPGHISIGDLDNIHVVKNNSEAMKIINKAHEIFKREGDSYCLNYKKYKLT